MSLGNRRMVELLFRGVFPYCGQREPGAGTGKSCCGRARLGGDRGSTPRALVLIVLRHRHCDLSCGLQKFLQPTLIADRDRLHLEARYNYEGIGSGSAWLGYSFSAGETLHLDLTAMAGAVFGKTHGYAPGYEFTLGWRKLQLHSGAEYVFDTDDSSESFLYTWSELTLTPKDCSSSAWPSREPGPTTRIWTSSEACSFASYTRP